MNFYYRTRQEYASFNITLIQVFFYWSFLLVYHIAHIHGKGVTERSSGSL